MDGKGKKERESLKDLETQETKEKRSSDHQIETDWKETVIEISFILGGLWSLFFYRPLITWLSLLS